MSRFANVVEIARGVDEVFSFVADFENVPRWNHAIEQTVATSSGPVGVGSTYRQVRTLPQRAEETFEVIRFDPGAGLAVRGVLGPLPAVVSYDLSPVAAGTRLVNTVDLKLRGALRMAGPLVVARVKSAVADNLAVLKRILESPR